MQSFFNVIWSISLELAPWLLLGTLVAGVLHVLLPADFLKRHLAGPQGVIKAVFFGVPLPLCSCGVIPVGVSLKKSGSSDGATVAFLISTPQTGIDSIFVSASLLGWPFAIFKLVSAAVTGILGGWLTNLTGDSSIVVDENDDEQPTSTTSSSPLAALIDHANELLYSIWRWLVVGLLVSAAIEVYLPTDVFSGLAAYGGIVAMLVVLLISLPLYVCATASVPIAASLVAGGLPTGAALVFLMAGPATNIATLGAVYRTLGGRPLIVYLATVVIGSIVCGLAFGFVVNTTHGSTLHDHGSATWWAQASAALLLAILAKYFFNDLRHLFRQGIPTHSAESEPSIEVAVNGMTCNSCVNRLEKTLNAADDVSAASVALQPGQVVVQGNISESKVRQLIEQAGFHPQ